MGGIVRYKVTRGDPQIPSDFRETPETLGSNLGLVKLQTSLINKFRLMNPNLHSPRERRKHYGSGLSEDSRIQPLTYYSFRLQTWKSLFTILSFPDCG
jgi:hypothetical protein